MERRRASRLAVGLALLAGGLAIGVSEAVFPYHSINHDEGVYLQQAAMLLEGRLFLRPPVVEAFRPWFFVRDGARLYPRYAPVPAAAFAAGELAGSARLALGAIAAAATWLSYAAVAEAFDRRRGLVAAAFLVASPLFLVQSAVFLPYLPTMALNLLFAFAYLRADRTGSRRWAAVAGSAVGVAFFARPYTAVLFAAPFVAHAAGTLRRPDRGTVLRHAITAALGLGGVGVAVGYNAIVTGSPLLFPYEAFAPADGLGFGRRALLGYEVEYTPTLALRANAEVLWVFLARWIAAGPLGAAVAAVGLVALVRRLRWPPSPVDARRLAVVGLLVSVAAGNLYFWGNLNALGDLSDPTDGLIANLGPYYHVDLLVPTAALAAHGLVTTADRAKDVAFTGPPSDVAGRVTLAALVLAVAAFGAASAAVAAGPLADNRAASDQLAAGYGPFSERELHDAVVLLPTPHGDWLNHPFQALRNDPGYDGPVLYAVDTRPFEVADAFPDRTLYRYSYRGTWAPTAGEPVTPRLRPIQVVSGERVVLDIDLGVPDGTRSTSIRLSANGESVYYAADPDSERLSLRLVVGRDRAYLEGAVGPEGASSVAVDAAEAVTLEPFLEHADGSGVTYRVRLPVDVDDDVRAITPRAAACVEPLRCGPAATGVPADASPGVRIDARLSADESA